MKQKKKEIGGRMNKKDFREITEILEANYNKKLDTRILDIWYQEFKEFTKEQYKEIIIKVIRSKKFMPSLAEIREIAGPIWMYREHKARIPTDKEMAEMLQILAEFIE